MGGAPRLAQGSWPPRRGRAGFVHTFSDRRWRQWIGLLRTAAATEGRAQVDRVDLWLAPHVVAASPDEAARVAAWVDAALLGAVPQDAPWLTHAVEAFEQQLQIEQTAEPEGGDDAAGKLALARAIGGTPGGANVHPDAAPMLRMVSSTLEARTRRRWSPVHVAARLAQLDELITSAQAAHAAAQAAGADLAAALAGRLWVPPPLARRWADAHAHTAGVLQALLGRAHAAREGYAALPVDDTLPAEAPPPLVLA